MTHDVIEKKWRRYVDLAVTVNDAAPCNKRLQMMSLHDVSDLNNLI